MLGTKFTCGSCAFGGEQLLKDFKQKSVITQFTFQENDGGGRVDITWGRGRPQQEYSTRRTLQRPAEALSFPLVMGVYCQAVWGLQAKFKLLNLALRPSFLHSRPPSLFPFLPSLPSFCLFIYMHTYKHTCIQTGPCPRPGYPFSSNSPFQILPFQAAHSLYSSSQVNASYFLHPKCLLSSTIPKPVA